MLEIVFGETEKAIEIMREVSRWGATKGYRVWPEEWLTRAALFSEEVSDDNFCIGKIGNETACAFILQWQDKEYWPSAPRHEAVYLHKFCVRRKYANQKMTKQVVSALRKYCQEKGIPYIRLDTASDETIVKGIYLDAGFQIVKTISYENGRSMDLYELRV